jgi:hypothetical protein
VSCSSDDEIDTTRNLHEQGGNYFICGSSFSKDLLNIFDIEQYIMAENDTIARTICTEENAYAPMTYEDSVQCLAFRTYIKTTKRPVIVGIQVQIKPNISGTDLDKHINLLYSTKTGQINNAPDAHTWASVNAQSSPMSLLWVNIAAEAQKANMSETTWLRYQAFTIENTEFFSY